MNPPNQNILLVEDDPDDVFFTEYALKKAGCSYAMHLVEDGEQAIDYLDGKHKYANRELFPLPRVVFLDLKLPCLSGFEVLSWIRSHPSLACLPVFVLTGSSEARDKERARELGANGYYVKPLQAAVARKILEMIETPAEA